MNDWQIFRVFARLVRIEHAHPARLLLADSYRQPGVRMQGAVNHGMNQEVVNLDAGQKVTLRAKQVL